MGPISNDRSAMTCSGMNWNGMPMGTPRPLSVAVEEPKPEEEIVLSKTVHGRLRERGATSLHDWMD